MNDYREALIDALLQTHSFEEAKAQTATLRAKCFPHLATREILLTQMEDKYAASILGADFRTRFDGS